MNFLMFFLQDQIPQELIYLFVTIFSLLGICSIAFGIQKEYKPTALSQELVLRTRSWTFIAIGISIIALGPPVIGTILLAYVSFVALREMFSISGMRASDRIALVIAYLAIPIQYYLAYKAYFTAFLVFIPLCMFMVIPFVLVLQGNTDRIGRSMPLIPTLLILTTYLLSHLVLLYSWDIDGFTMGYGGLIMYLILLTAFNDVFQFTWGKLLGKRKILPKVSPNKTWEGFLGGIMTTALLAYALRFLTPLNEWQAILMGLALGIMGFFGDSLVSAIKRDLKIKDTDDLIPGHGGIMDRLDSLVVTAPVYYHLLRTFILT